MDFGFGIELYPSQRQLIKDATEIIQNRQIGIISSPTGTGKTISLLCTVMSFIKHRVDDDDLYAILGTHTKTSVYYCSRTHSQLNQVVQELRRNEKAYNTVILGSRKQYCLNASINKTADLNLLNEKCRDLVANSGCEYYKGRDFYSTKCMDIEDLKRAGRERTFCPYYYTKNQASNCELVLLPYNLLFTKEGRNSLDIDLEGKILIIDEAHNIYDTIIQLNSVELSWTDIKLVSTLKGLSKKFSEVLRILLDFHRTIRQETIVPVLKFIIDCKIAEFNMFEIEESIIADKLAQKNNMHVIFDIAKFLKLLTYSDENGRVIYNRQTIRFTPLNPQIYFQELKNVNLSYLPAAPWSLWTSCAPSFPGSGTIATPRYPLISYH